MRHKCTHCCWGSCLLLTQNKGSNLFDKYQNLGANWFPITIYACGGKEIHSCFFFFFLLNQSVSQQSQNWDRFTEKDWLLLHTLSSWKAEGRTNVDLHKERKDFAMFSTKRNTIQHFRLRRQVPRKGRRWSYCAHLCVCVCPLFSEPASASLSLIMSTRHKTAVNICSFVYLANI